MNLEKTALVTHQGCMDGSTCALVFMVAGGKKENIFFTAPGHDKTDDIVNYLAETWQGDILVADASISLSLAEKLNKKNTPIRILDHHKSAIPLNKFSWCEIEVENKRAGGKMLYDYFMSYFSSDRIFASILNKYEDLVNAADDVDRWVWKHPSSENLVTFHDALEQERFIERFDDNPSLRFVSEEKYLIEVYKHKREIFVERKKESATMTMQKVQGHDVKIAVVEAGTQQSMLGNDLCTDPEYNADIAVIINARSVSFRASKNCPVDLSKVAELNGGGGHAKAAGAALPGILGGDFIALISKMIKWG